MKKNISLQIMKCQYNIENRMTDDALHFASSSKGQLGSEKILLVPPRLLPNRNSLSSQGALFSLVLLLLFSIYYL